MGGSVLQGSSVTQRFIKPHATMGKRKTPNILTANVAQWAPEPPKMSMVLLGDLQKKADEAALPPPQLFPQDALLRRCAGKVSPVLRESKKIQGQFRASNWGPYIRGRELHHCATGVLESNQDFFDSHDSGDHPCFG